MALALAMVLLGLWLPIQTTRFEPDEAVGGLNRIHFMAIPMIAILTFGGLRRRRESLVSSHRETKATAPVLDSTRVIVSYAPCTSGSANPKRVIMPVHNNYHRR